MMAPNQTKNQDRKVKKRTVAVRRVRRNISLTEVSNRSCQLEVESGNSQKTLLERKTSGEKEIVRKSRNSQSVKKSIPEYKPKIRVISKRKTHLRGLVNSRRQSVRVSDQNGNVKSTLTNRIRSSLNTSVTRYGNKSLKRHHGDIQKQKLVGKSIQQHIPCSMSSVKTTNSVGNIHGNKVIDLEISTITMDRHIDRHSDIDEYNKSDVLSKHEFIKKPKVKARYTDLDSAISEGDSMDTSDADDPRNSVIYPPESSKKPSPNRFVNVSLEKITLPANMSVRNLSIDLSKREYLSFTDGEKSNKTNKEGSSVNIQKWQETAFSKRLGEARKASKPFMSQFTRDLKKVGHRQTESQENTDNNKVENTDRNQAENTDSNKLENTDSNKAENTDSIKVENTDSSKAENTDSNKVEYTDNNKAENNDSNKIENTSGNKVENTNTNIAENTDSNKAENTTGNKVETLKSANSNKMEKIEDNKEENIKGNKQETMIDSRQETSSNNKEMNSYDNKEDDFLTKKEVLDKLHNKTFMLIIEKACLDGTVISLPVQTTVVLKTSKKSYSRVSGSGKIQKLSSLKKSRVSVTNGDRLTTLSKQHNSADNRLLSNQDNSADNRLLSNQDNSADNRLLSNQDNSADNRLLSNQDNSADGFPWLNDGSIRENENEPFVMQYEGCTGEVDETLGLDLCELQNETADAELSEDNHDVDTPGEKLLPLGNTGKCNHQMPIWDFHDYCKKCRRSDLLPWAQNCQKNGAKCEVCESWTDEMWSYRSKPGKKRKRRKKLENRDSPRYSQLPKLSKYNETKPRHQTHTVKNADPNTIMSPPRTSSRRSKVKTCSCCVPNMPVLKPYGFDEEELFEEDIEAEIKPFNKPRTKSRRSSLGSKSGRRPGRPSKGSRGHSEVVPVNPGESYKTLATKEYQSKFPPGSTPSCGVIPGKPVYSSQGYKPSNSPQTVQQGYKPSNSPQTVQQGYKPSNSPQTVQQGSQIVRDYTFEPPPMGFRPQSPSGVYGAQSPPLIYRAPSPPLMYRAPSLPQSPPGIYRIRSPPTVQPEMQTSVSNIPSPVPFGVHNNQQVVVQNSAHSDAPKLLHLLSHGQTADLPISSCSSLMRPTVVSNNTQPVSYTQNVPVSQGNSTAFLHNSYAQVLQGLPNTYRHTMSQLPVDSRTVSQLPVDTTSNPISQTGNAQLAQPYSIGQSLPTAHTTNSKSISVTKEPTTITQGYRQTYPHWKSEHGKPNYGQPVPSQGKPVPNYGKQVPSQGKPVSSLGKPVPSQGKPVPSQGKPVPSQGKPVPSQGKQVPNYGKLVSFQGKPVMNYGKPIPSLGKPVRSQLKPVASYGKPIPSLGKPVPSQLKPVSIHGKPVPSHGKPVPSHGKPVPFLGKPVPIHGKPVPSQVKPVSTQGKPVPFVGKSSHSRTSKNISSGVTSGQDSDLPDSFNIIDFVLSDVNLKANYKDIDQQTRKSLSINVNNQQQKSVNQYSGSSGSSVSAFTSPTDSVLSRASTSSLHSTGHFSPDIDKPKQAKARTKADILARLKWKKTARKSISEDALSPCSNGSPRTSPELSPAYGPATTSKAEKINKSKGDTSTISKGDTSTISKGGTSTILMITQKKVSIVLEDIMKAKNLNPECKKYVKQLKAGKLLPVQVSSKSSKPVTAEDRTAANSCKPVTAEDRTAANSYKPVTAEDRTAGHSCKPVTAEDRTAANSCKPVTAEDRTAGHSSAYDNNSNTINSSTSNGNSLNLSNTLNKLNKEVVNKQIDQKSNEIIKPDDNKTTSLRTQQAVNYERSNSPRTQQEVKYERSILHDKADSIVKDFHHNEDDGYKDEDRHGDNDEDHSSHSKVDTIQKTKPSAKSNKSDESAKSDKITKPSAKRNKFSKSAKNDKSGESDAKDVKQTIGSDFKPDDEQTIPSDLEPDVSDEEPDYDEWMRATMLDSTAEDALCFDDDVINGSHGDVTDSTITIDLSQTDTMDESESETIQETIGLSQTDTMSESETIKETQNKYKAKHAKSKVKNSTKDDNRANISSDAEGFSSQQESEAEFDLQKLVAKKLEKDTNTDDIVDEGVEENMEDTVSDTEVNHIEHKMKVKELRQNETGKTHTELRANKPTSKSDCKIDNNDKQSRLTDNKSLRLTVDRNGKTKVITNSINVTKSNEYDTLNKVTTPVKDMNDDGSVSTNSQCVYVRESYCDNLEPLDLNKNSKKGEPLISESLMTEHKTTSVLTNDDVKKDGNSGDVVNLSGAVQIYNVDYNKNTSMTHIVDLTGATKTSGVIINTGATCDIVKSDDNNTFISQGQLNDNNTSIGEGQLNDNNTSIGEGQLNDNNTSIGEGQLNDNNTSTGEGQLNDTLTSLSDSEVPTQDDHTQQLLYQQQQTQQRRKDPIPQTLSQQHLQQNQQHRLSTVAGTSTHQQLPAKPINNRNLQNTARINAALNMLDLASSFTTAFNYPTNTMFRPPLDGDTSSDTSMQRLESDSSFDYIPAYEDISDTEANSPMPQPVDLSKQGPYANKQYPEMARNIQGQKIAGAYSKTVVNSDSMSGHNIVEGIGGLKSNMKENDKKPAESLDMSGNKTNDNSNNNGHQDTRKLYVNSGVYPQQSTQPVVNSGVYPQQSTQPVVNSGVYPQQSTQPVVVNSGVYPRQSTQPVVNSGVYPRQSTQPVVNSGEYPRQTTQPVLNSGVYPRQTTQPIVNSGVYPRQTTQPVVCNTTVLQPNIIGTRGTNIPTVVGLLEEEEEETEESELYEDSPEDALNLTLEGADNDTDTIEQFSGNMPGGSSKPRSQGHRISDNGNMETMRLNSIYQPADEIMIDPADPNIVKITATNIVDPAIALSTDGTNDYDQMDPAIALSWADCARVDPAIAWSSADYARVDPAIAWSTASCSRVDPAIALSMDGTADYGLNVSSDSEEDTSGLELFSQTKSSDDSDIIPRRLSSGKKKVMCDRINLINSSSDEEILRCVSFFSQREDIVVISDESDDEEESFKTLSQCVVIKKEDDVFVKTEKTASDNEDNEDWGSDDNINYETIDLTDFEVQWNVNEKGEAAVVLKDIMKDKTLSPTTSKFVERARVLSPDTHTLNDRDKTLVNESNSERIDKARRKLLHGDAVVLVRDIMKDTAVEGPSNGHAIQLLHEHSDDTRTCEGGFELIKPNDPGIQSITKLQKRLDIVVDTDVIPPEQGLEDSQTSIELTQEFCKDLFESEMYEDEDVIHVDDGKPTEMNLDDIPDSQLEEQLSKKYLQNTPVKSPMKSKNEYHNKYADLSSSEEDEKSAEISESFVNLPKAKVVIKSIGVEPWHKQEVDDTVSPETTMSETLSSINSDKMRSLPRAKVVINDIFSDSSDFTSPKYVYNKKKESRTSINKNSIFGDDSKRQQHSGKKDLFSDGSMSPKVMVTDVFRDGSLTPKVLVTDVFSDSSLSPVSSKVVDDFQQNDVKISKALNTYTRKKNMETDNINNTNNMSVERTISDSTDFEMVDDAPRSIFGRKKRSSEDITMETDTNSSYKMETVRKKMKLQMDTGIKLSEVEGENEDEQSSDIIVLSDVEDNITDDLIIDQGHVGKAITTSTPITGPSNEMDGMETVPSKLDKNLFDGSKSISKVIETDKKELDSSSLGIDKRELGSSSIGIDKRELGSSSLGIDKRELGSSSIDVESVHVDSNITIKQEEVEQVLSLPQFGIDDDMDDIYSCDQGSDITSPDLQPNTDRSPQLDTDVQPKRNKSPQLQPNTRKTTLGLKPNTDKSAQIDPDLKTFNSSWSMDPFNSSWSKDTLYSPWSNDTLYSPWSHDTLYSPWSHDTLNSPWSKDKVTTSQSKKCRLKLKRCSENIDSGNSQSSGNDSLNNSFTHSGNTLRPAIEHKKQTPASEVQGQTAEYIDISSEEDSEILPNIDCNEPVNLDVGSSETDIHCEGSVTKQRRMDKDLDEESTDGYLNKESTDGYLKESTDGYLKESTDRYLNKESTDRYLKESTDGYLKESTDGYLKESTDGYLNKESKDGYLNKESTDGYLNKESTDGYLKESTDGYLNKESTDGYLKESTDGDLKGSTDGYLKESTDGDLNKESTDGYLNKESTDGYLNKDKTDRILNKCKTNRELDKRSAGKTDKEKHRELDTSDKKYEEDDGEQISESEEIAVHKDNNIKKKPIETREDKTVSYQSNDERIKTAGTKDSNKRPKEQYMDKKRDKPRSNSGEKPKHRHKVRSSSGEMPKHSDKTRNSSGEKPRHRDKTQTSSGKCTIQSYTLGISSDQKHGLSSGEKPRHSDQSGPSAGEKPTHDNEKVDIIKPTTLSHDKMKSKSFPGIMLTEAQPLSDKRGNNYLKTGKYRPSNNKQRTVSDDKEVSKLTTDIFGTTDDITEKHTSEHGKDFYKKYGLEEYRIFGTKDDVTEKRTSEHGKDFYKKYGLIESSKVSWPKRQGSGGIYSDIGIKKKRLEAPLMKKITNKNHIKLPKVSSVNKGRLSPLSKQIRMARIAEVARQKSMARTAEVARQKSMARTAEVARQKSKEIHAAPLGVNYCSSKPKILSRTEDGLFKTINQENQSLEHMDDDEDILHASQSADIGFKKRRDNNDFSQLFQDLPTANTAILDLKSKSSNTSSEKEQCSQADLIEKHPIKTTENWNSDINKVTERNVCDNRVKQRSLEYSCSYKSITDTNSTKQRDFSHSMMSSYVQGKYSQRRENQTRVVDKPQDTEDCHGDMNKTKSINSRHDPNVIKNRSGNHDCVMDTNKAGSWDGSHDTVKKAQVQNGNHGYMNKAPTSNDNILDAMLQSLDKVCSKHTGKRNAVPCVKQPKAPVVDNIPAKFNSQPSADLVNKTEKSLNDFLFRIYKWSAKWLEEQDQIGATPPVLDKDEVYPLCPTYNSYEEYVKIMTPLFMLETWESVYKSWFEDKKQSRVTKFESFIVCRNVQNDRNNKAMECRFQGKLQTQMPKEGDLVVVHLQCGPAGKPTQHKPVFGYVTKYKKGTASTFQELHSTFASPADKHSVIVEFSIQMLYRKLHVNPQMSIVIEVVTSLVSQIRQYTALLFLPKSPLARDILRPCNTRVFHCKYNTENTKIYGNYNRSQSAAIFSVCSAAQEPYAIPKICMLQGPPGTGKSTTIVGIISRIINSHIPSKSSPKPKILLCAPSNGGIDELVRRLIKERKKIENKPGNDKPLNFVRVGNPSSIHPDVQSYSLPEIIQRNFKAVRHENLKKKMSSVASALEDLTVKIERSRHKVREYTRHNKTTEAAKEEKELAFFMKKKKNIERSSNLEKPMMFEEERQMRRRVLQMADVVCCTLNSSGSNKLMECMTSEKTGGSHFTCVIIDEATQTTEVDSLIPLQFGCTKLILVGDPEQLPATVLSKKAELQNFSQSLFERLYIYFKGNPYNPVQMLEQQYRMHPEICHFPSQHIYDDRLKTHSEVAKWRAQFPLKPYLVFDTKFTQERSYGTGSTCNPKEASVVADLCNVMYQSKSLYDRQIGVVTPYQKQKTIIIDMLRLKGLNHIEVSTIDSYQGREKDIIIMSCVRSNSQSGSIGFVADRRRMNVALTRARYSLYIVGDLQSLKVNEDWQSLITDAQKRDMIVCINSESDVQWKLQKNIWK